MHWNQQARHLSVLVHAGYESRQPRYRSYLLSCYGRMLITRKYSNAASQWTVTSNVLPCGIIVSITFGAWRSPWTNFRVNFVVKRYSRCSWTWLAESCREWVLSELLANNMGMANMKTYYTSCLASVMLSQRAGWICMKTTTTIFHSPSFEPTT
jgi:hypothetical protein